jgi:hypothetical protein
MRAGTVAVTPLAATSSICVFPAIVGVPAVMTIMLPVELRVKTVLRLSVSDPPFVNVNGVVADVKNVVEPPDEVTTALAPSVIDLNVTPLSSSIIIAVVPFMVISQLLAVTAPTVLPICKVALAPLIVIPFPQFRVPLPSIVISLVAVIVVPVQLMA